MQRAQARATGRLQHVIDVSTLASGPYVVRVSGLDGRVLGSTKAEVR
jgi:hypothetical protein